MVAGLANRQKNIILLAILHILRRVLQVGSSSPAIRARNGLVKTLNT